MSPRPKALLAPTQSAAFSMARALLLFDAWEDLDQGPLEIDRALLFDFVLQNPRLFLPLITDLDPVLRAYGLEQAGISDLFAHRGFETTRERFQATVSELVARDLLTESTDGARSADSSVFRISPAGRVTARLFTSEMANAIKATALVTCTHWRRRSHAELQRLIRRSLPDQASEAARMTRPFAQWLLDVE
jgi:hypothetical protein